MTIDHDCAAAALVETVTEETSFPSKATPNTTAATTATSTTFENYLVLAEKALRRSHESLDTRALVQLAYGDDTAHIGGSDMLMGILESVLDKIVRETILEELKTFGTTSKTAIQNIEVNDEHTTVTRIIPKERLDEIDQATSYVVNWENRRDQIEGLDAKSARESLHQNLLPEGVTMEDVITHREHDRRLQARAALLVELQRIEDEILVFQNQSNVKENKIREKLGRVDKVEQELEASANACAMVTS